MAIVCGLRVVSNRIIHDFIMFFFLRSSFNDFSSKYAKDERYKNIEKMRERESLFNEFILEVRKREKEEKNHKREQVIINKRQLTKCLVLILKYFMGNLHSFPQIRKDFFDLLREHSEIDRHSRWSDVKKKLDSDSRYKLVDSSSLREDYFRDYIRILKDERRHRDREKSRKEKTDNKDQESDPVSNMR